MRSMAGPRARMAGVFAAEAMSVDDGACVARRGAHLCGSSFLVRPVSTVWGAAWEGRTLCV